MQDIPKTSSQEEKRKARAPSDHKRRSVYAARKYILQDDDRIEYNPDTRHCCAKFRFFMDALRSKENDQWAAARECAMENTPEKQ